MSFWDEFPGPNAGYMLELHDRYRQNPDSVDAGTRAYFENWTMPAELAAQGTPGLALDKIVGAVNLAQSIRAYGHLAATLDPLHGHSRGDPSLQLGTYGLLEDNLRALPARLVGGPVAEHAENAWEAVRLLRVIYSSTTGYSYEHIHDPEEREWLRHAAESRRFRPTHDTLDPIVLLRRLTSVAVLESFLHRTFPGKTRFSLEGLDMLVPMLDEIHCEAAAACIRNVLLGMAHRGRLNVMVNVLNKPIRQILAEFRDPLHARDTTEREELGWTGDVKYHLGARREADQDDECELQIIMPPNPSHVEAIDPVVEGMARAAGTRTEQSGAPQFDPAVSLPILVHGDAAFPGEGIVAETLNLSHLPGYQTGGTIHIIANNQLGYTTPPKEARSTLYASDLAKGFEVPIVHVNADDPESCIEAARLAAGYRARFHKDFMIDLVGYRRHGHNEGDEPSFTQPVMYEKIQQHPGVRELWSKTCIERGLIEQDKAQGLVEENWQKLQTALEAVRPEDLPELQLRIPPRDAARHVKTAVSLQQLRTLNQALLHVPEAFTLNPKLERAMRRRQKALEDPAARDVDWATAEQLAFATILQDAIAIRLTGEDVERGTFGQRHAVFHDARTGATFTPLQALPQAQAAFEVHNSPLTEAATVGFEYGYNVQKPTRLVIWEAQYGDFINQAQVMLDEFIVSARAKWGQTPSLVLLLPHAAEGQGPDHSGARLERFLQLSAETNLRIAYPTTAAQYFHLLRRQALLLETDPLPLIVLTPKSLLRHPETASSGGELAEGAWQPLIADARAHEQPEQISRVILCSGKVYFDLDTSEERKTSPSIAIVRVEQIYPFPSEKVGPALEEYPNLEEVVWLQEEPENMGAWTFVQPRLLELLNGRIPLRSVARPQNSSPGEGSSSRYAMNQKQLIARAFEQVHERQSSKSARRV